MTEERILSAVERIDDAMTRIEAAASRPSSPQIPNSSGARDDAALTELAQRHDAMRGQVQAAVAELDMLIRNG